ncbi:hypothetical protein C6P46_005155 [Rhodotorula mucilaginosa]|uniref:Uncharacterized protein n=1 Tax=Rhodotorula mucilaginosa TaxID=5537 RepID=A0A9P7B5Q5_RHOMI|nr:hypothetical protein C6P46_005155 [Rhodotorula mucilaginosa]TKA55030.1 hypothetical protein B0A53_02505 [Rhodotorula sp. CCFEE 5036]
MAKAAGEQSHSPADALRAYLAIIPEYSTARVQFYYSSLPSRKHSNPTGYASALAWWRKTLVDLTARGLLGDDKLVLHVDEHLREHLRWDKIGRPSSLGVITAELAQSSDLVRESEYLSSPDPQSFSVLSLLARPFWWTLSTVLGTGSSSSSSSIEYGEAADQKEWTKRQGDYVVPDLVERAASQLTPKLDNLHADALSRLYTLKTFRERLGPLCLPNVTLSERDCRVLATYLSRKGLCGFDGEVIKFLAPHSTPIPSQPVPITAADRSTLSLLASVASLSASISSLEDRITAARNKAARYAAQKRVELAKAALVEKRRDEKLLEERVGQRLKVQEVVSAIERAVGDEETLSALTLGTSTLRAVLASPTLQLDNISELTSALDEQLVSAQEVSEAVDAVGAPEREAAIDENEVEEEWEKLVKEEEEREERQKVEEAKRKLETPAPMPSTSQAEEVESKTETPADKPSKEPVPLQ